MVRAGQPMCLTSEIGSAQLTLVSSCWKSQKANIVRFGERESCNVCYKHELSFPPQNY